MTTRNSDDHSQLEFRNYLKDPLLNHQFPAKMTIDHGKPITIEPRNRKLTFTGAPNHPVI